jgi:hypothetical protein
MLQLSMKQGSRLIPSRCTVRSSENENICSSSGSGGAQEKGKTG